MTASIIHGDGFAVLASLADGSVDHVITDPPYTPRSTKARTNKRSAAQTGTGGDAAIAAGVGAWDAPTLARFAAECLRVSRRWVVIFCELESLGTFAALPGFVRSMIWDRHSTPQVSGDRPAQPAEGLAIMSASTTPHVAGALASSLRSTAVQADAAGFEPDRDRFDALADLIECGAVELVRRADVEDPAAMALLHNPGRKSWNGGGKRGIYRHPIARGAARSPHPAQKPGNLILDLVQDFTDPGDSVLDPCCGVGTVPIIADGVGRIGVGVESSRVWAARAILRAKGDAAWLAPLTDDERRALEVGT